MQLPAEATRRSRVPALAGPHPAFRGPVLRRSNLNATNRCLRCARPGKREVNVGAEGVGRARLGANETSASKYRYRSGPVRTSAWSSFTTTCALQSRPRCRRAQTANPRSAGQGM